MSNAEEKPSKASTDMLPLLRESYRSLTGYKLYNFSLHVKIFYEDIE